ncbi:helix-turn-helix transcriptional regulator [Sphingomonas sp. RRHST34]|uniref:Helix-turn-helix transcriptional regulator n=1 Tax=Sphingomonas citri TaxID=2862499 RepID=A0ABS7BSD6_9SPHN|nr:helix-turn-helix domain-containing protein [Sphingomonas citri]MBW6532528.1 helix-turn-helix transcriptional regulator [Sphingomonas citri]
MNMVPSARSSIEELVTAKWGIAILRTLLAGPARFSGLREAIPGVSANILAARLRLYEQAGLVERVRLPEPADRQVYRLTPRGAGSRAVIDAISDWSAHWDRCGDVLGQEHPTRL